MHHCTTCIPEIQKKAHHVKDICCIWVDSCSWITPSQVHNDLCNAQPYPFLCTFIASKCLYYVLCTNYFTYLVSSGQIIVWYSRKGGLLLFWGEIYSNLQIFLASGCKLCISKRASLISGTALDNVVTNTSVEIFDFIINVNYYYYCYWLNIYNYYYI